MSIKCAEVHLDEQTTFQHLTVFRNDGPWGNVMTLDGAIQLTDKDEFVYHEMMAHVPLCAHVGGSSSKDVLIIGGGDGGVMREVLRHPEVKHCDLVDIDGNVIEASKRFFPQIAVGFSDARATAIVGDRAKVVTDCTENRYDVIIIDSSDPVKPSTKVFSVH